MLQVKFFQVCAHKHSTEIYQHNEFPSCLLKRETTQRNTAKTYSAIFVYISLTKHTFGFMSSLMCAFTLLMTVSQSLFVFISKVLDEFEECRPITFLQLGKLKLPLCA